MADPKRKAAGKTQRPTKKRPTKRPRRAHARTQNRPKAPPPRISAGPPPADWPERFISAIRGELPGSERGHVTRACEMAGIGRSAAYERRDTDLEYRAAWDAVVEGLLDDLETAAIRRATRGTSRPVVHDGGVVHDPRTGELIEQTVQESALAIFTLKARRGWRDGGEADQRTDRPAVAIHLHADQRGAKVRLPDDAT